MKSTWIGMIGGIAVSCGLLALLALWPLPIELESPAPGNPAPAIPPPAAEMETENPPATASIEPETRPIETETGRPSPQPSPARPETPPQTTARKDRTIAKQVESGLRPVPEKAPAKPSRSPEPSRETKAPGDDASQNAGPERLEAAGSPVVAPAPPPPPSLDQSDLNAIDGLLNRLRSAYLHKDLALLKQLSALSNDKEESLKKIFGYYKTLHVEIEAVKAADGGAATTLVIASAQNEKGNAVIPSPRWGRQPLIITPRNHQWDQIRFSESGSGNPPATPIDWSAPTILHSIPTYVAHPGKPAEITAEITDNTAVASAALRFRAPGDSEFESMPMTEEENHLYTARIPGSMVRNSHIEYYIEARDSEGNLAREGRTDAPLAIAVSSTPGDE